MGGTSFEISTRARRLAAALMDITDANGEVNEQAYDAWLAEVEATNADIKSKLQSIRAVRTRLLAEAETLKAEAARIATIAKRRTGDADRLRGYMKNLLLAHQEANPGTSKVDCDDGHVRLDKRASYTVEVGSCGFTEFSDKWLAEQSPKIDKRKVVAALRNGSVTVGVLERDGILVTKSEDLIVVEGK